MEPGNQQENQTNDPLTNSSVDTSTPLNKIDVPKKWGQFQQLKSMVAGLGFLIVSPLIGYAFYQKGNHQAAKLVTGIGIIFGLIVFIGSWISFRQLRSAEKKPKSFTQFQTSTAAEYSAPQGVAQTATSSEPIIDWLGPITRVDKGAIGHTVLSKEVVKQAENTFLFTDSQIIAIMLTQDDAQGVQGALGTAASTFIKYSADSAVDKAQDMRILYQRHWDQLMTNLLSRPLNEILQSHFNYAIPYSEIKSFKVKSGFLNPGFILELTNGSKMRFAVSPKQKSKAVDTLKRHVSKY